MFLDLLVSYFQYHPHIFHENPHYHSQTKLISHSLYSQTKPPTLVSTSHSPIYQVVSLLCCNVQCSTPYHLSIHLPQFYHHKMDKIKYQSPRGFQLRSHLHILVELYLFQKFSKQNQKKFYIDIRHPFPDKTGVK